MTRLHKKTVLASLTVFFGLGFVFSACSNSIGEDDLDRWTNNAEGLSRMQDLFENPQSTTEELRIRALEIITEKNRSAEIARMLRGAPDRTLLADRFVERNLSKLQGADRKAAVTRDGLIRAAAFCSPKWTVRVKEKIADWAFQGLTENSPKTEVKTQIEKRIRVNQLVFLGKYSWRTAGLLIRHGWNLAELTSFLSKVKDPEAQEILAAALIALHKENPKYEWPSDHLMMIENGASGRAFVTMMDLYQNEEAEDEVRDNALNAALACGQRALKDERTSKATRARLEKILDGPSVDDRWIAMNVLVEQLGDSAVDTCLKSLSDTVNYTLVEQNEPGKNLIDFCGDTLKKHAKKSNEKVLRLMKTGNTVQRVLSVVCAKVWNHRGSIGVLSKIAKGRRSPSLSAVLADVKTLADLAMNALDGMTIVREVEAAQKKGKMSEKEAKRRIFLATVLLSKSGAALRKEIDETLREEKKSWSKPDSSSK
jgi:hypothetical protein